MYTTYILENTINKLYIGHTYDIAHRLWQHNSGAVKYTKNKGVWKIIYTKDFPTKSEAYQYERYLKSLKSPKYLRKQIINSQLAA